ncbi:hypothetical protein RI367_003668 [Sorochytrium milnesiophthora]
MSATGSLTDLTAEHESNNAESRDARINARRARVTTLRNAKKAPQSSEGTYPFQWHCKNAVRRQKKDSESQEVGGSQRQISASRKQIDTTKNAGVDDVSNVRVTAVERETHRRQEEQKKAAILQRKHQESNETADTIAAQIQATWERALAQKGPYELYQMLEVQRTACEELMSTRNKLLIEYQAELKRKDDDYVKELKRQADEIDQLLGRMDKQFREYKQVLRSECEQIERAFVEERNELIQKNTKEVDELFEKRRRNESKYMDDRANTIDEHVRLVEEIRVRDAEDYNLQKIRLEKDVQVLEQQLQQMRATYQLNTEKLEYNSSVLKKRDEENTITINQQKRKITRLTDIVNSLRTKLAKQEKSYAQEYSSLTDDFNRISMQFRELQKKFKHFQLNDEKQYQEVWEMNEEMVKEQLHKILMADRIIYERELRLPWTPPASIESVNSLVTAKSEVNPIAQSSGSSKPGTAANKQPVSEITTRLADSNNALVKRMLELLINEASFLVEEKLLRLLKPLPKGEQFLMKLDTIFKSLGIESNADIERLLTHFILPQHHASIPDISAELSGTQPVLSEDLRGPTKPAHEEEEEEEDPEAMTIHPNEVVRVIRYFLKEKNVRTFSRAGTPARNREQLEISFSQDSEGAENGGNASKAENGEMRRKAVQDFWTRLANTLDDGKFGLWNSILSSMEAYHLLLTTRFKLSNEVQALEQQNSELKLLLREYMGARVNQELEVPPSRVIMSHAKV